MSLMLSFVSCAHQPFPFYDSAVDDHNRAPASIAVPKNSDEAQLGQDLNDKIRADYLFLSADMKSLDGQSESAIQDLKTALVIDPESATLMYRLAVEYYRKGQQLFILPEIITCLCVEFLCAFHYQHFVRRD